MHNRKKYRKENKLRLEDQGASYDFGIQKKYNKQKMLGLTPDGKIDEFGA